MSLQVLCFPVHIAFLFYFVLGFSMGIDQLQCNFNLRNITVHWLTCDVINYILYKMPYPSTCTLALVLVAQLHCVSSWNFQQ